MKAVLKWGAIGFVALVVIAAIVGGGSDKASDERAGDATTPTAEAPATKTAAPKPKASPKAKAKRFAGNGGKTIPAFELEEDSTLTWTATGGLFQIFDQPTGGPNAGVPVNSQGSKGNTVLKSGEHELQVNALGDWTIRITPGT